MSDPYDVAVCPTRAHFHIRADGPVPLIEVGGEIDLSNADTLAGCLSVFEPGDAVVVDLSRLRFLDSRGVAKLVQTCNRGVMVTCRGAQGTVRRAIELCGLDTFLTLDG